MVAPARRDSSSAMATFQTIIGGTYRSSGIVRVRTGCITCKRRHLKCDESKPKCMKCEKANRICRYHSSSYYFRPAVYSGDSIDSVLEEHLSGPSSTSGTQTPVIADGDEHAAVTTSSEPAALAEAVALARDDDVAVDDDHDHDHDVTRTSPAPSSSTLDSEKYAVAEALHDTHLSSILPMSSPASISASAPASQQLPPSPPIAVECDTNAIAVEWHPYCPPSLEETTDISSRLSIASLIGRGRSEKDKFAAAAAVHSGLGLVQLSDTPVHITPDEFSLVQNFANRIGPWFDLFDPDCGYSRDVTRMAFYDPTIMKSVLAISSKQLSLTSHYDFKVSVQYYDDALKFVRQSLASNENYLSSPEIFVATVTLSVYEMLAPADADWRRHLKGATSLAMSLGVNSKSPGALRTAFWSYARQDVVSSLLMGSRIRFDPPLWHVDMNSWMSEPEWKVGEAANNIIYLWALVANYCAHQSLQYGDRVSEAMELETSLATWRSRLDKTFEPLWVSTGFKDGITRYFYHPPEAGLALQVYHSARLILAANRPPPKGMNVIQHCRKLKQTMADDCDRIIGISLCCEDEPCSLLSIHCLHAAGQFTDNPVKRLIILQLVQQVQDRCGWETRYVREELLREWNSDTHET
ncbi:uncharacterized protein V1518DRAFT_414047 [Limtongia smithiae]|uniref:uncharacterized protein n=1 Tax=Limtongia smithiae TaxID=1125753 RepID=UPI0034CF38DB